MKSKAQQHSTSLSLYESNKGQPNNSSVLNTALNYSLKKDELEKGQSLTQATLSQSFQNEYLNVPIQSNYERMPQDPNQFLPNLKKSQMKESGDTEKNDNGITNSNYNLQCQDTIVTKTCSSSVSKHSPDRNYSGKKNQSLQPHNNNLNPYGDYSNNNQQIMNFPSLQKENTDRQIQMMQKMKSNTSKKGNSFRIKKSAYLFSQNNMQSPPQNQGQQGQQNQQQQQQQGSALNQPFNYQQQQQQILQQIQAQQQMLQQITAKVPQQQNLGGSQANTKGSQIIQQLKKSYLNQIMKSSEKQNIKGKFIGEEYGLQNHFQGIKNNGLFIDNRNQVVKRTNITIVNNSVNLQFISVPPSQDSDKPPLMQQPQQQPSQYSIIQQHQVRSISQTQKPTSMLRNQKSLKDLNERSVNEFDGFLNTRDFFSTKQQREPPQDNANTLTTLDTNKEKQTFQQQKFLQVISTMNSKSLRNSEKLSQLQSLQSDRRNTSHSISKITQGNISNRRISNLNCSSLTKNANNEGVEECLDDQSIISGQTTKNEIEDDVQGSKNEQSNMLKLESDRTYHLICQLKCVELKLLFAKQRQQFHKRVLVIHFETVFLTQSNQYFWENWSASVNQNGSEGGNGGTLNYQSIQNSIGNSGNSGSNQVNMKENYFAKFRIDLKRFMKNICKKYTVILIFQGRKRSKDLFHYLLRMNYLFDGAYQMEEQECAKQDIIRSPTLAINYNYIISDFYKTKKPTSFTVMDCVSSEFILPNSQVFIDPVTQQSTAFVEKSNMHHFSCKIPKVKISQHKIRVILMKNRQYSPKYPDCAHLADVINSGEKKDVLKNNCIISYKLKMNKIMQQNISNIEQKISITNYFNQVEKIKVTNKVNCRVRNEAESDKKLEAFRNLMVEYIKSFKNSDKILHLHSLIGDIVVRNRDIFKLYYKDSFYSKPYHSSNLQQIYQNLTKVFTINSTSSKNYPHQNDPFTSMPDFSNQPEINEQNKPKQQYLHTHTADLLNLEQEDEPKQNTHTNQLTLQNFNLCIFFVLSCEIWKV